MTKWIVINEYFDRAIPAKMIAEMTDRDEAKKLAQNFAKIYATQNQRFDFTRFYSACKVQ